MPRLLLYSKAGCHLCEDAQRVVQAALGKPVPEVDIAMDERVMRRYLLRIPVLLRTDTGQELGWPFGPADVVAFTGGPPAEQPPSPWRQR